MRITLFPYNNLILLLISYQTQKKKKSKENFSKILLF